MSAGSISDKTVRRVLQSVSEWKALGQRVEPLRGHPFPARMPLSLTEHLVKGLTNADAVVVDPMAGSGTTVIAAKRLGRTGIGIDRDPLAVRIARTAICVHDRDALTETAHLILDDAKRLVQQKRVNVKEYQDGLAAEDRRFLRYWFPLESRRQLLALVNAIGLAHLSQGVRDFAMVVVSSLIIAKSAGASHALDIARSRPHKVIDKPIAIPFDAWSRRFAAAVARHLFFEPEKDAGSAQVHTGDARSLPLKAGTVDLVLTSPPYLNAIDYMRAHKFSLVWMGYDLDALRELRGTMIGTERGLTEVDGLPSVVEARLCAAQCEAGRKARLRRYLSDLGKTFAEISRVLKPGALAVLVAGPTIINRARTDVAELLTEIADLHGLDFIEAVTRRISPGRRSLPPPGKAGPSNPLAARMRREVLVALRKRQGD